MSDIKTIQERRDELIREAKYETSDSCQEISSTSIWLANLASCLEEKLKVARSRNVELMELVEIKKGV